MTYSPFQLGLASIGRFQQQNQTGNTLVKGTPIRVTSTGAQKVDPSVEDSADAIAGVVKTNLADGSVGEIVTSGTIEDVSLSFAVGKSMWVDKSGNLTDQKPTIGENGFTHGDWVIRVGVVGKNVSNPFLKDLLVNIQIMGQL